ncbi:hypothetical protein J6590_096330 [Homalodisca vitripennis]|nr:hypothetical protein J6590_096330 [Homalodisca vitripennis]
MPETATQCHGHHKLRNPGFVHITYQYVLQAESTRMIVRWCVADLRVSKILDFSCRIQTHMYYKQRVAGFSNTQHEYGTRYKNDSPMVFGRLGCLQDFGFLLQDPDTYVLQAESGGYKNDSPMVFGRLGCLQDFGFLLQDPDTYVLQAESGGFLQYATRIRNWDMNNSPMVFGRLGYLQDF